MIKMCVPSVIQVIILTVSNFVKEFLQRIVYNIMKINNNVKYVMKNMFQS